jgi:cobalt-zinc-cadmium efflux system membrane fusion protein
MLNKKIVIIVIIAALVAVAFFSFGSKPTHDEGHAKGGHGAEQAAEFERGPHRGRLLRDGDFALEITIFEDNVPPQFHLYVYDDDKPLDPKTVQATIQLSRLDGEVNTFNFTPKEDYLDGGATVVEPHSFDVKVEATYDGKAHHWEFSSYEGRVTIAPEAAEAAGIAVEKAGPATIREKLALSGRIVLDPNRSAQVKARFPGVVREMRKNLGDTVQAGDVLAMVESNDSLQVYPVKAPIGGTIIDRNGGVGDVAGDTPLYQVADLSTVWAEFHVFPRDLNRVKPGQSVHVKSMEGDMESDASIAAVPPVAVATSQTVLARATLDNSEGKWRSGMTVRGDVVVAEREVQLAVKATGLQRFRDFTVVFAQVGDTYEVRMLELGMNDGEMVEVLGGLKPGMPYVSDNSFLIKADIEKSGASHDH